MLEQQQLIGMQLSKELVHNNMKKLIIGLYLCLPFVVMSQSFPFIDGWQFSDIRVLNEQNEIPVMWVDGSGFTRNTNFPIRLVPGFVTAAYEQGSNAISALVPALITAAINGISIPTATSSTWTPTSNQLYTNGTGRIAQLSYSVSNAAGITGNCGHDLLVKTNGDSTFRLVRSATITTALAVSISTLPMDTTYNVYASAQFYVSNKTTSGTSTITTGSGQLTYLP